jgi:Na+/H+-dicarboxylate symporter
MVASANLNTNPSLRPLRRLVGYLSPKYLMWHICIAFAAAILLPWLLEDTVKPFIDLMQVPKDLFSLVVKVLAPVIAFSALFTGILKSLRSGSRRSFFGSVGFYLLMCSAAVAIAFPIGYIASEFMDNTSIKKLIEGNLDAATSATPLDKASAVAASIATTQAEQAEATLEAGQVVATINGDKAETFAVQMNAMSTAQERMAEGYTNLANALKPAEETIFSKLTHSFILWAVFLAVMAAFMADAKYREAETVLSSPTANDGKRDDAQKLLKAADNFVGFFEYLKPVAIQVLFLCVAVLSPFAIIGSLGAVILKYGIGVLNAYKDIMLLVFFALACQAALLFVVTKVLAKVNPFRIFSMSKRTLLLAASTASSKACLPYAMEDVEKMGVGRRFVDYQIALGSSINMDGTAIYMGIMAFVFSYAWTGAHPDVPTMLQLIFSCTVFAIGAAGIPAGSLIFLSTIFPSVGVPAAAVFAIQPVDAFLDRGRTVLNIWGDITGAVTRAALEGELDRSVLNSTTDGGDNHGGGNDAARPPQTLSANVSLGENLHTPPSSIGNDVVAGSRRVVDDEAA